MKIKKKLILPILSLASLMAIGVGTTYALFTSNAETNISVKAGKVNVSTAIDGDTFKTYSAEGELKGIPDEDEDLIVETTTAGVFANGGTATHDGVNVTLTNITPGDRVAFDVLIQNSSTVKIKYRPKFKIVSGEELVSALKITIDGKEYVEDQQIDRWAEVDVPENEGDTIKTLSVVVDLPSDKGNDYQEAECVIAIDVDAVQGNAKVKNEPGPLYPLDVYKNMWWNEDELGRPSGLPYNGEINFYKANEYSAGGYYKTWACPLGVTGYLYLYRSEDPEEPVEQESFVIDFVAPGDKILLNNEYRFVTNVPNAYFEEGMFQDASFPWGVRINNVDIFDTSEISDFSYMFMDSTIDGSALTGFDTSCAVNMSYMFQNTFWDGVLDLSNFDTSNVTNMKYMFRGTYDKTTDLSNFDTSKVTDMSFMFFETYGLEDMHIENWDTSNVTNMSNMFNDGFYHHGNIDLSKWDTSNVTDMSGMFASSTFTRLDLSSWDTSNVTNFYYMFAYSFYEEEAEYLNVEGLVTASAINLSRMFEGINSTDNIDLSSWDTSNVTDMQEMFYYSEFSSINVSCFDVSKVENFASMFAGCKAKSIDVTSWNTVGEKNFSYMFSWAENLETIYASDTFVVSTECRMFYNSTKLVGGAGTKCDGLYKDSSIYARIDGGEANPGYFTLKTA